MHTSTIRPQATARRPFTALVISPDPVRRSMLTAMAEQLGARNIVPASSGSAGLRAASEATDTGNDICLLDGSVHDTAILGLVHNLRLLGWQRVLLMTGRRDAYAVRSALSVGIYGYVVANPTSLPTTTGPGIAELTEREIEVLQAASEGMSNKAIGAYLGLSSLTVKSHMARIGRKLGIGDRAALVAIAMRAGIID